MAAPVTAAATACSKCDGVFSSGGHQLAGSCSSCADGDALCQKCVARHTTDARFAGHACRAFDVVYTGADFLARLGLFPAPKSCLRHSQPFLSVLCVTCSDSAAIMPNSLCGVCVNEHAVLHPLHELTLYTPNVAEIKAQMGALAAVTAPIRGERVTEAALAAAQSSPLVESARRRALAAQAELDALATHKDASVAQLEANRDAVIASTQACFRVSIDAVLSASATKQAALEAELEAADAALSAAIAASAAIAEVRCRAWATMVLQSLILFW